MNKLDTCIIVEPRQHKYLFPVIDNILENIPKETVVQIYHGNKNKQMVTDNYKSLLNEKVFLHDMKVDNLKIHEYSKLLTSTKFYNDVKGENMLIFQTDSCINSNNKHGYIEYLDYDYVGAPWSHSAWINVKNNPGNVGNGGFSLRKKSSCLKALQTVKYRGCNEDIYWVNIPFFKYPTDAKSFSIEHCFHPNPFGVHAVWKFWHSWKPEERQELCSNFKEMKTIFNF